MHRLSLPPSFPPSSLQPPPPTLLATRAGLDCNLLASWLILPGSAHCLRHDPLWYAGYDVGPGAVDFAINVTATRGNSSAGPASTASLALSPAVPAAASPGAGIAARLLGDLAAYRAMPDFGGHVLMVPFPPGEKRNTQAGRERETGGGGGGGGCFFLFFPHPPPPLPPPTSRLHPRHRPDLQPVRLADGGPVSDLPVGHGVRPGGDQLRGLPGAAGEKRENGGESARSLEGEAGRGGAHPVFNLFSLCPKKKNACSQPAGTCLANQLADLAAADAARVAAGKGPLYRLTRWGGGTPGARQAFRRAPSGPLWLGLPLPSTTASIVTLALDAAGLRLVTAVAAGVIDAVAVCARPAAGGGAGTLLPVPADPAGCRPAGPGASFQALSGAGALAVTLRNAGALAAQFTVAVANCTGGVLDPPAAVAALGPGSAGVVEFALAATAAAGCGRPGVGWPSWTRRARPRPPWPSPFPSMPPTLRSRPSTRAA